MGSKRKLIVLDRNNRKEQTSRGTKKTEQRKNKKGNKRKKEIRKREKTPNPKEGERKNLSPLCFVYIFE